MERLRERYLGLDVAGLAVNAYSKEVVDKIG